MTASFGATILNGSGETARLMLHRADAALYEAKHGGRNRLVAKLGRATARVSRATALRCRPVACSADGVSCVPMPHADG